MFQIQTRYTQLLEYLEQLKRWNSAILKWRLVVLILTEERNKEQYAISFLGLFMVLPPPNVFFYCDKPIYLSPFLFTVS